MQSTKCSREARQIGEFMYNKVFLFIQVIYLNSFKDILKWMEISIVKHKKEPLKESTNKHESQ